MATQTLSTRLKQIVFTILLSPALFSASAQSTDHEPAKRKAATSGELFDVISRMDTAMFAAFNAHAVDRLMVLFTDDLEFYHDSGGLNDHRGTKHDFTQLFAQSPDIKRDLVQGSMEVYPIKDHGAIQVGEHRFCHTERGQPDCGTFKFLMVWRKTGDSWKVSRVISYGH
jgi:ketosteroid isomerase-like protein